MNATYYPRVTTFHVRDTIEQMCTSDAVELSRLSATSHPMMFSYQGHVADLSFHLKDLRVQLVQLAGECGFPQSSVEQFRRFDQQASHILYEHLNLIPSEAASIEVWNFITIVLLPDIAKWRYPNPSNKKNYDRWIGENRNTFRKLWWREYILGHELNSQLGEDEASGIMERSRIGGDPKLARVLASALVETSQRFPDISRSELMRRGILNFRRRIPVTAFELYSEHELRERLISIFTEAAESFAVEGAEA
ncbi:MULTISPECIES: hypothetical protein [Corynebacterium]|uniref:hypothetical protein n=1 Tax=Corynebacterium TaxID=1716 RepID=UPI00124E9F5E|nr:MULTISPECIES: hypothetical protein [Corynebacterium]